MLTRVDDVQALVPYNGYKPETVRARIMDLTSVRECMDLEPSPVNAATYLATCTATRSGGGYGSAASYWNTWVGAPSFDVAVQRTRDGWPEGYARVRECLSLLALPSLPKRRRVRLSDDGPDLNLDRFLDGSDLCWNVRRRVPIPTVDMTVTIGAHGGVSADELFWRGAATVAIVDSLERAGYRLRVTALSLSAQVYATGVAGAPTAAFTRVRIKDYNEPLRPAHIAATVCTPALFRIGCFRSRCTSDTPVSYGFGSTREPGAASCAALHVGHKVDSLESAKALLADLSKRPVHTFQGTAR